MFLFLFACETKDQPSDSRPVSHELWDELVREHVSSAGLVDYRGLQTDSARLKTYLNLLERNHPNDRHWSRAEQIAYWINAYNAFTLQLVLEHYPVESIKDVKRGIPFVNTVWDVKFIRIEDRLYDLNNLEHGILRARFDEPRIHFAVNCASFSCPRLRNEAYTADRLDEQLDDQARAFLADTTKNVITSDRVRLSSIFQWYRGDFTDDQSLIDYLNRYAPVRIEENAKIEFMEYDWRLNDLPERANSEIRF